MALSKKQIIERLNRNENNDPIVITPILDRGMQIGPCGIDVRLGKQFIVFNANVQDTFSFDNKKDVDVYYNEIILSMRESIIIHPGKVIISSTLEYVSIPTNIECQVEGRSSWARLGLVIASASTVEPGYKGVITLELSNIGEIPITLCPGLRIAQLIFYELSSKATDEYNGNAKKKYSCNIGPRPSKIAEDPDIKYFTKRK
jgi:dCTP deaminase